MYLILDPFRRWRDYSGRARRREFWTYAFLTFAAMKAAGFLEDLLGLTSVNDAGETDASLRAIVLLGLMIPGLAVSVRRLHDSDRAGWWLLLPVAPLLIVIAGVIGGFDSDALFWPAAATGVGGPLVLLGLMCIPGTRGPNRFGADPRPDSLADIFA